MPEDYTAHASIDIKAPASRVWEALTDPAQVKEYLFGTDMKADLVVGGKITYTGEWEGKAYEDHGTILRLEPGSLLETTYWSGASGLPDLPENYQIVTYELEEKDGVTTLNLTQSGSKTEEARDHSESNWKQVLEGMKKMIEKE